SSLLSLLCLIHFSPSFSLHSPLLFLFFFFYYSGHHRDLHSFPTRRSSDLPAPSPSRGGPVRRHQPGAHSRAVSSGRRRRPLLTRSEEHTSELQSRFDLVCRLLLEKKKKKILIYDNRLLIIT